jgi:short-subunit dehydrogenase involved in D-alanine esterification of teichoic acids
LLEEGKTVHLGSRPAQRPRVARKGVDVRRGNFNNIVSVLHLTAALLPILKEHPNSTIITTTSGLAFVPRANFPTYCASKAFLHSWLQSLRFQLRETSVEVLEFAPAYVQTELGFPGESAKFWAPVW